MPSPPRIDGERIYLRGLTEADATERYCAWLNDPEINRYLETRYEEQRPEDITTFIAAKIASTDEWLFGIFLKPDGRHIGNIKLGPLRARHRLADVSLFIGVRSVHGKGYGSEAIRLVTDHAFEALGLNKLMAGMYAGNRASIGAFRRAGWTEEARLKDHYLIDGGPTDIVLFGHATREYAARGSA